MQKNMIDMLTADLSASNRKILEVSKRVAATPKEKKTATHTE